MMSLSRRDALKLALRSGAAAVVAPALLLPKRARATEATGKVRHVLVLNLRGGFRSHCTFNAVGRFQHNPFGAQETSGSEWKLGSACGRVSYDTSLGRVPAFADVVGDVCVLGAVDQNPGGPVEIDHVAGQRRIGTGFADGQNGILSLVGAHHPLYADGFRADVLPPVEIVPTDLGLGEGDYGERRPLSLFGAQFGNGGAAGGTTPGWHTDLRAQMDTRFLARKSRAYQKRLKAFRLAKANAALFSTMLSDPRLDVEDAADAADAGVSNAQLLEVLGNHDLMELGDPQSSLSWGADIALALRCFSLGAPIVSVARDVYDMHDLEAQAYAPRTQDLVRQLAGLHFLLHRMPHPEGGTYWDKTLVVTLSEFSRNNTQETTGFNSGSGSDHVGDHGAPARHQALVMMGGVVRSAGKLIGHTNEDMEAEDGVVGTRDVLATVLDVLGVDPAPHLGAAAIAGVFA